MRDVILDFMKNRKDRWFSLKELYNELKQVHNSMDFNLRRVRNGVMSLRRARALETNYAECGAFCQVFRYRGRML